jgi:hypothetical protein
MRKLCIKHYALVHSKTSIYTYSIRNPVRTGIVPLLIQGSYFLINIMRQMFMRQIVADAISVLFQKITRQMLCDKCSKNDVTLPKNADVIWRENYADPQNADVTSAARCLGISTYNVCDYPAIYICYLPPARSGHWAIILLEELLLSFRQSFKCSQKHGGSYAIAMTTGSYFSW